MSSAARRLNAAATQAAEVGTLAPATMRVASTYFLSPGGTGNSANSGTWGMMSSGSSGSANRGSPLQLRQLRPDQGVVGVLLEPLLEALDVVQPFGWDWHPIHRHQSASAHMATACRAISHLGQSRRLREGPGIVRPGRVGLVEPHGSGQVCGVLVRRWCVERSGVAAAVVH